MNAKSAIQTLKNSSKSNVKLFKEIDLGKRQTILAAWKVLALTYKEREIF